MNTRHMHLQPKQQNVDLWEAWIDLQTTTNSGTATLYLIGDIFTENVFAKPFFKKREDYIPDVLSLEIIHGITSEDGYPTEIMYSEELQEVDQYKTIFIYAGNELLTQIGDIEKIA